MKIRLFCCFFFLCFYLASAQNEAAIWYFGEKAGLDFNSGSPVAITDGEIETNEGCAVISDRAGKLLFYTDGITVYNRQHKIMLNGTALKGHHSSTHSGIIVPQPGNPDIYFVFTTDAEFGVQGLRYSKVDMSLDGGLGGVTSTKNVLLEKVTTEKLTAVEIPGEDAFWVVGHKAHSDEFLAYKISASGVHTNPVKSAVGPLVTLPPENAQGQIKISPDGQKLAIATRGSGFELYDFDSSTGKVSNFRQIALDYMSAYGVEFSPNSEFLYTGSNKQGLFQYDLNAASHEEMINSRIMIAGKNRMVWALQLAIDGKIYVATTLNKTSGAKYIDVIHQPNARGAASNYQREVVHLSGATAQLGLPPFIQSYFHTNHVLAENFCAGSPTSFSLTETGNLSHVLWDFGDGNTSNKNSPAHTYQAPGEYVVKVTWTAGGMTDTETTTVNILATPEAKEINDLFFCFEEEGQTFDLSSLTADVLGDQSGTDFEVFFFSSEVDAESNTNPLPETIELTTGEETIYARVHNKENPVCYDISSFKLVVQERPLIHAVQDWIVCGPDGSFNFDLAQKDSEVFGGQKNPLYSVSYFRSAQEAEDNINPVTLLNIMAEDGETRVYFRVQGQNASCSSTGSFALQVTKSFSNAISPENQFTCDEGGGFGTFDTSLWLENILRGQSGYKVSFSTEDGNALPDPLPAIYQNRTPNSERIIARIATEKNPLCISETSFELVVNPKERLVLEETYYLCESEGSLELNIPGGFDSWEWIFEDGTVVSHTSEAVLSREGIYSLTVSNSTKEVSCAATYTFELIISPSPEITDVKYGNRAGQSFIEITATGEDLEFSIDGISYQDHNLFTNVPGGRYNVFVRNRTGCGIATEEVVFLDFPKYFTPNNDGYNDHWQIGPFPNLPETPLYIFDRYGKLLKQLSTKGPGWDGTFNGRQMPPDDYWFSVDIEGERIRSHFTLMR